MGFATGRDDQLSTWQIIAIFAGGVGCGIALGFMAGHALGFYFGRIVERKRISKLLAGKTAIEVVTQLMKTGKIEPAERKKSTLKQAWPPRDETRH